jgi:hypothetical protein
MSKYKYNLPIGVNLAEIQASELQAVFNKIIRLRLIYFIILYYKNEYS